MFRKQEGCKMSGLAPRGGQDGVTVKIVQLGDKWSLFQHTESCICYITLGFEGRSKSSPGLHDLFICRAHTCVSANA